MAKIYRVEHYWAGTEEGPAAYYLAFAKKPTVEQAVEALDIDWDGEDIQIYEEDVVGAPLILLDNVDWEMLREQKLVLLGAIDDAGDEQEPEEGGGPLCGILHLLDEIQGQAADVLGEEVVFKFEEE